jgi:uncharacterized membrane protein YdjX (TVP38/TMEM64 family)
VRPARIAALTTLAVCVVIAFYARTHLDVTWDAAAVRALVSGYGVVAPLALVLLVACRLLLLLPSQVVLVAAGVCFGFLPGALYGTVGLCISGAVAFGLARGLGGGDFERRVPARLSRVFASASERTGMLVVALLTGAPLGPMTAVHIGAGLTRMSVVRFGLALVIGSAARAALYTYLGDRLVVALGA